MRLLRRRGVVLLGVIAVSSVLFTGCTAVTSLINTDQALRDAGYQSVSVNFNTGSGDEVDASVKVSAPASDTDAQDVARIVWNHFHERFQWLHVTVGGTGGTRVFRVYAHQDLVALFGARNPAWDRTTLKSGIERLGVVVIGVVALVVLAIILVIVLTRRRRRGGPGGGYPGGGYPAGAYPGGPGGAWVPGVGWQPGTGQQPPPAQGEWRPPPTGAWQPSPGGGWQPNPLWPAPQGPPPSPQGGQPAPGPPAQGPPPPQGPPPAQPPPHGQPPGQGTGWGSPPEER